MPNESIYALLASRDEAVWLGNRLACESIDEQLAALGVSVSDYGSGGWVYRLPPDPGPVLKTGREGPVIKNCHFKAFGTLGTIPLDAGVKERLLGIDPDRRA